MTKTEFRLKVEEQLKDLAKKPKTKLKIAFEVNGKMKGTTISEGGDVDILFSPRQEVMYVDFSETSKSKIELIKTRMELLKKDQEIAFLRRQLNGQSNIEFDDETSLILIS